MRLPGIRLKEDHQNILLAALKGAVKGGVTGTAASMATGAAVIFTVPAWLPIIGGAAAVSTGTVAVCAGVGGAVGAAAGGLRAWGMKRKTDRQFAEAGFKD